MLNAYKHIHFKSDGDAKHLGGTEKANISFDEDFFKGKYVVMFDDIITSGKSMERMKKKLESFGAVVLGGISIGKTKHERVEGMSQVRRLIVTTI